MTDNLPDNRPPSPLVAFKRDLKRLKDAGELDMLPADVSFESFKNAAVVAITDNPKILHCQQDSIFKSVRRLASAGLVPDGREAALVPFKTRDGSGNYVDVCQAMPMVLGLIKVARNTGEVSDIRAHIVYQAEMDAGRFTYLAGDDEQIEHDPILFGDKGDPVGAYAIAKMKDGTVIREVMDKSRIDRARKAGASQLVFQKGAKPTVSAEPKGVWADWWEDMWKKTVIRAMVKRLPMSAENMRRIADMDETRHEMKDVTPEPSAPRKNLAQRLSEPSQGGGSLDGDVLPPEQEDTPTGASHWTDEIPHDDAFPGSGQYDEGAKAFKADTPYRDNPYGDDPDKAVDWAGGWLGQKAAQA